MPFRIEVEGIDCWVRHDPTLKTRGIVRNAPGCREIALREYDERVLLHEVLHRLIQTQHPDWAGSAIEERLVHGIELGLWEMGWRWSAA
jgi:hypothetical protein